MSTGTVISYCPSCNRVSGFSYWLLCWWKWLSAMVAGGTDIL
jgi:hypothetical protein